MSTILYLSTAPPPALPGTDAVFQDIEQLRAHFGGTFLSLYPLRKPSRFVPSWLMGIHNRGALQEAMAKASLIHVFNATLTPLPCLSGFTGPIVYSVTASVGTSIRKSWFERRRVTVVTSHERDRQALLARGFPSVACILPGLDTTGFSYTPAPESPFTLLVGSAPWTKAQFRTKGIDVLIAAMRHIPDLHLVFLWRHLWHDALIARIRKAGLEARTTIINERVDVNQVLARSHATVVLAAHERLVKAWPHSAIESLAAGKPVLLSRAIPMAAFAEKHRAGVAVETLNLRDVQAAIQALRRNDAEQCGESLKRIAETNFDLHVMRHKYQQIYQAMA